MRPTPLGSAAEVLVATGHDPFARGSLRRPVVKGWSGEGATAWLGTDAEERRSYLSALGSPPAVAALIAEILDEIGHGQRLTVPRGTPVHLPAWVAVDGTDWDFRWTDAAPPAQAGEDRVVAVDDDAAVSALLDAASPTTSARPGDEAVRGWVGVFDGEGLVACAADTSGATGVGHLSAIAVHPRARGTGLGSAVTARLVRQLLEQGCDMVTLGMYADNTAGRALYDRLGMHDDHPFTSGPLQVRSRW